MKQESDQPSAASPPREFRGLTLAELRGLARAGAHWLWRGFVAAGNVTLLTSQWKTGKTTLASLLLDRLGCGSALAGLGVAAGRAALVTEEPKAHWVNRADRLAFGEHVRWFCRPFSGKPRLHEWCALLDHLAALKAREGLDLVVIDPVASFLPGDENSATGMLGGLLPLQRLTRAGVAVLVLHHPRKGEVAPGQAARGSGALSGYVDVLIEMGWYGRGDEDDRRRRLRAWSRHDETPRRLVMELNAEGTDYTGLGDFAQEAFTRAWRQLKAVLAEASAKLTRAEVLDEWPADEPRPAPVTLWRWLERAAADGLVLCDGQGRKGKPYRYWLPGQEEKWRANPFYVPESPEVEELLAGNAEAEAFLLRMGLLDDEEAERPRKRRK